MGVLEYYEIFQNKIVNIPPKNTYIPEEHKVIPIDFEFNSTPLTLAEQSPESAGKLTAHRIRDYRRSQFSLLLLPDVDILFDKFFFDKEVKDELL